jgi:hypothetical protein
VYLDGTFARLDEDEFEHNTLRFAYPPALIERALAACREVEAGLASRSFPFDYENQVELYQRIKKT